MKSAELGKLNMLRYSKPSYDLIVIAKFESRFGCACVVCDYAYVCVCTYVNVYVDVHVQMKVLTSAKCSARRHLLTRNVVILKSAELGKQNMSRYSNPSYDLIVIAKIRKPFRVCACCM